MMDWETAVGVAVSSFSKNDFASGFASESF
jgi:hypothetical protein